MLCLIAFGLRLFRGEHPLDDSREAAAGIFAGSGGEAESCCSYHRGMQVRVASHHRSGEAIRLPVSEALRSDLVTPECDCWPLVVG